MQIATVRRTTLAGLFFLAALLAPGFPAVSLHPAGVMLVCNTTCTGGVCTASAFCSPGVPNTCAFNGESVVAANNAMVNLGAVDGMAMVTATMGTPATGSIYFSNLCGATTMCTMGFFTTVVNVCVVDTADGLPVELMDFSIEA